MDEEQALVVRAKDGDLEAFQALYRSYVDRIHDFCFGMLRSRADAEDVTSDTFLKAMERLEDLREPAAFRGWLYSIARNAALNHIEARKKTASMPEDFEPTAPLDTYQEPVAPERAVTDAELSELVWEAAATLNPRDYSVFDMTVRQGLGSGEVAEALDVKPSHAYVLVNRLQGRVEDALGAVVVARVGRRDCPDLDRVLERFGDERTPKMRKAVNRHLRDCERCEGSKKKYASAAALLAGVPAASASEGFVEELSREIGRRWPDRHIPRDRAKAKRRRRRQRTGVVAASVVAITILGLQPWAGTPEPVTPVVDVDATASPSPSATPAPTAEPSASPTVAPTDGTPRPRRTPTPTQAPQTTPAPVAGPSVTSVGIDRSPLYDDPRCGPTQGTVTARVSAPAGVSSVMLTAEKDGSRITKSMVGSGSTWQAGIGPYGSSGTASYFVTVTDASGKQAVSSVRSVQIAPCRGQTNPTPTPTPRLR